jgi:hypothetical protein
LQHEHELAVGRPHLLGVHDLVPPPHLEDLAEEGFVVGHALNRGLFGALFKVVAAEQPEQLPQHLIKLGTHPLILTISARVWVGECVHQRA